MHQQSLRELQLDLSGTDANSSLAETTKIKYRSALTSYLNFCQNHNLPVSPSIESISRYISVSCRSPSSRTHQNLSPRSVEAYLSGITHSLKHMFPHTSKITNSSEVRAVMKGCKRQFSKPVARKDPLSMEDIIMVHSGCGYSHDELLFLAMITVGFHALHRLGELSQPDSKKLRDERKIIKRDSLSFSRCGRYAKYVLPHNKCDQFYLGEQVLLATCDILGASV